MTKMQILAKSILTVLGIHGLVIAYGYYPGHYVSKGTALPVLTEVLSLSAFTVLAASVVYFLVFKNTRLSQKIAGPGQVLDPADARVWLVKSLRIGLLFTGLMLLVGSMQDLVKILKVFLLIRPAVSDIIAFKSIPRILRLSYPQWYRNIYGFLKVLLAIYLICGAPHLVRWQVRHTATADSNTKPESIPDSVNTTSQGKTNE